MRWLVGSIATGRTSPGWHRRLRLRGEHDRDRDRPSRVHDGPGDDDRDEPRSREPRLDLPPGSLDTVTVGNVTYQVISPLPIVPYLAFVPIVGPVGKLTLDRLDRVRDRRGVDDPATRATLRSRRVSDVVAGDHGRLRDPSLDVIGQRQLLLPRPCRGHGIHVGRTARMARTPTAMGDRTCDRPREPGATDPSARGHPDRSRPDRVQSGRRLWTAVSFGFPLALAVATTALYDFVRFGSPLETGYGTSVLLREDLLRERAKGVFSLRHLPDNLGLLLARGFDLRGRFPWLVPDPNGHSILLTSPGLLIAVWAGVRSRSAQVLWAAAFLVAVPVLFYLRRRRVPDIRVSVRARLHPVPPRSRRDRGAPEVRLAREGLDRVKRRLRGVRHRVGRLRITALNGAAHTPRSPCRARRPRRRGRRPTSRRAAGA